MTRFEEYFNLSRLAEERRDELIKRYGYDKSCFGIYYDAGLRRWVLVYEP